LRFVSPLGHFRGEHESESYFLNEYLPLHRSNWNNSLAERRAHLNIIRKFASFPARPRLLDVGCALGLMLHEASAASWEAIGVETSEFAAHYAAVHTGCQVYTGTLQDAHFESESFDVVTLMDVIEHVPWPRALIAEVHRVLRPGGVVFLVTPNFASLFVRLYGAKAYGIGPEEHVTYFQPSTIRQLLQANGFTRIVTGSKDFYAENLRRLMPRANTGKGEAIKNSVGSRSSLRLLRNIANAILMHIPIGDKLIAIGAK
jgi:2-polyprenyl-3-methyl-5-hydroxy-6-metoxy-1,4-benzoquinol methylase